MMIFTCENCNDKRIWRNSFLCVIWADQIPKWWIWAYWISPMMYAQNSLAINEFLGDRWRKVKDVCIRYTTYIYNCLFNYVLFSYPTALQWKPRCEYSRYSCVEVQRAAYRGKLVLDWRWWSNWAHHPL
jgi:ABC-type multidrug transport system permease subunit